MNSDHENSTGHEDHLPEGIPALEHFVQLDRDDPLPLYAQLHRGLRHLIDMHFDHGQRFYNEEYLSRRLGLSLGTVRRALADLTGEGLLERRVARGSFVCKQAVSASSFTVGVFLPAYDSSFTALLLEHISTECRRRSFMTRIFHTHHSEPDAPVDDLVQGAPHDHGFLLLGNHPETTLRLYCSLESRGFRTVNMDTLLPDYPGRYVGVDNTAGIRMAMQHLSELGHRRITLLVDQPLCHLNVQERVRAFEDIARDQGLEHANLAVCKDQEYFEDIAMEAQVDTLVDDDLVGALLADAPTAVLAVSDPGAWVLIKRLAQRGIPVPEEISVFGFGDERFSRFVHPELTTVAQPYDEMARLAVSMLTDGQEVGPRAVQIAPTLLARASTGPAPKRQGITEPDAGRVRAVS